MPIITMSMARVRSRVKRLLQRPAKPQICASPSPSPSPSPSSSSSSSASPTSILKKTPARARQGARRVHWYDLQATGSLARPAPGPPPAAVAPPPAEGSAADALDLLRSEPFAMDFDVRDDRDTVDGVAWRSRRRATLVRLFRSQPLRVCAVIEEEDEEEEEQ